MEYIPERPADNSLPEVISDEEDLPIYISSYEEEEGEYEVGMEGIVGIVSEGLELPPLSSDDKDEHEKDGNQVVESDEEVRL